jgi:hypothetical protein
MPGWEIRDTHAEWEHDEVEIAIRRTPGKQHITELAQPGIAEAEEALRQDEPMKNIEDPAWAGAAAERAYQKWITGDAGPAYIGSNDVKDGFVSGYLAALENEHTTR